MLSLLSINNLKSKKLTKGVDDAAALGAPVAGQVDGDAEEEEEEADPINHGLLEDGETQDEEQGGQSQDHQGKGYLGRGGERLEGIYINRINV